MNYILSILLSVVVSAQMDSTYIVLGDQTRLHLEATASSGETVGLPQFDKQVIEDLLVVDKTPIDTNVQKDGRITYSQDYTITAFKDSLFFVEPIPFVVNGDTVRSASMTLNVINPFEMDSTMAITDIKAIEKAPIWWWGIIRWILLALLLVGAGVGIYFLVDWLQKRLQTKEEEQINPELLRPCDEVALEKLDAIKEEKAWQQGEHKKYFSELTFVIREYIGRRYDVQSNEKTSDETLQAMKPILQSEQKELYVKLEKMLRLADLVKFAKWQPTPDEEEMSLHAAYEFVNTTKPTEEDKGKQGEATDDDFVTVE